MINNYNSLSGGRDTWLKNDVGDTGASPPLSKSKTTFNTWLSGLLLLCCILFTGHSAMAQIAVTVTNPGNATKPGAVPLSSSYVTFSSAIADLNQVTAMTGPIILTCTSGQSETTAVKGIGLGSATLNPVLSATNTITINKSGAGAVTLNAGVGTSAGPTASPDGIFYLNGADYVTIDGLTFTDGNSTDATVSMEFGLAFFKLSAGDGCNNNTVKNCTFNMQRINNTAPASGPMMDGAYGIEVVNCTAAAAVTSLTPTNGGTLATNGTNSGNAFYSNTVNGGNGGIGFGGYAASTGVGPTPTVTTFLGDVNNIVGASTLGNTVQNFGGGASTNPSAGIRANNQWSINISYNTVNNNTGTGVNHATTLRGIYAQAGTSGNVTITNNTVTVKGGATTSTITGIDNAIGTTALSNTVSITNNIVQNCTYTTATTGTFIGINTSATATNVNVNSNQVINNNIGASGVGSTCVFMGIYNAGSSTNYTANSNTIANNSLLNSFGTFYGIRGSTSTILVDGNTISNISMPNSSGATSATLYGYYDGSSPATETVTNNNINNITVNGNSTATGHVIYGIFNNTATGTKVFSGNNINTLTFTSSGAGYATVAGIRNAYNTTATIAKNVIHTLSSTGTTPTVAGLYLGSTSVTTFNVSNNIIGNLTTPQSTGFNLFGIYCGSASTTINLYYNTVYLNGTSSGTGFASAAVYQSSTTPTVTLIDNILVNLSTPTGTGITAAFRRPSAALASYGSTSNNNLFYAGTASATRLLYYDGTNSYQTLSAYKTAVTPRETASIAEAVSSTAGTFFQSFTGPASGTSTTFLHLVNGLSTQVESGGVTISGYTDDYDGNTRNVSTPDMGADEFSGTLLDLTAPTISYTALGSGCGAGSRTLTATITDLSGVPTSGAGLPVLYWKINAGAYTAATATSLGGNQYQFTLGTGSLVGDTVSYYIVAQDNAGTPNVGASPAAGASGFTANPPAASTPPTTPSSYTNVGTLAGGTYTVGSGGDYATLTAAVNAYNTLCIAGPVVFNLTGSTYNAAGGETFPISINANTGASAVNTLTIKPATTATITGTVASGALIVLNGADYVTIDGSNAGGTDRSLTITNAGTTSPTAVALVSLGTAAGATFDVVKNCNISTGVAGTSGFGVAVGGSTPGTSGADNDNVTIQNNNITVAPVSIYANGTASVSAGGLDALAITGNTVDNNTTLSTVYGIQVGNALNSTVNGNTVSVQTSGSTQPVGISLETGFVNSTVNGNKITKVLTTATGGYGGRGITVGTGTATSALTISNNFVAGVNGSNYSSFTNSSSMGICIGTIGNSGTLTTTTGGVNLFYNTVNMAGNYAYAASTITAALYVGTGATTIDVRDNIFVNSMNNTDAGGTGAKNYTVYSAAANTAFSSINYNDYYVSGTQGVLGYIGSDRTDLAGMVTGFGGNANSKNVGPVFTSATDLHLVVTSNPNLDNFGTALAVTTDIDGTTRSATPDMGADEFTTPIISDTGVTAIVFPTGACPGGPSTVQATIKNFGTTTVTSATVSWSVTPGGAQPDVTPSLSLAPGASVNVTLGTFTFSTGTTYSITAATSLPNGAADGVPANDSFTNAAVTTGLNGTYTVGSGGNYATLTAAVADYNAKSLCGAVTFNLTDATYGAGETFPIVINANTSASATNTLTIKPTGTTTISGATASGSLITLNGADYVTIDGSNNGTSSRNLTITNTSTTSPTAIALKSLGTALGATNDIVKNCNISTGVSGATGYGIAVGGATPGSAGADNDNVTLQNNNITVATVSIYANGTAAVSAGGLDALAINGNTVDTNTTIANIGIQVGNALNSTVNGNTVSVLTSASNQPVGISLEGGFVSSTVNGNKITKAQTTATGGYGGRGITVGTGTATSALTISNNFIAGVNGSNYSSFTNSSSMGICIGTVGASGTLTTTAGGINLYYNTVNMAGNYAYAASTITAALYVGSGATALDVRDNIFVNTMNNTDSSGTGAKNYTVYSVAANTAFSNINYNDYYTSGTQGVLGYIASTDRTDLAGMVSGFGGNANSKNVVANFTSATDLHLVPGTNVALDNFGTALAVTTDIDGTTRSATPDMGADEFDVVYCSQTGLTAGTASSPTLAYCSTGSPVISATGYSSGNGATYQWFSSLDGFATAGTAIGSASANYANLSPGAITVTTSYRLRVICSAGTPVDSNVVTITINTPATINVSAGVVICNGQNTTLTASAATGTVNTYTWSPTTGLSGDLTSGSVTAAPTATTTYTVYGTDNHNCQTTSKTIVVTVNEYPSAVSFTQGGSLCAGGIVSLTANGGVFTGPVLSDGFNVASPNFTAATVSGTTTTSATIDNTYFTEGTGSVRFNTTGTSSVATYTMNSNVNLSGASTAKVTFSHMAIMEGPTTSYDYGYVEYSTDNGANWTTFPSTAYAGSGTVFTSLVKFSTKSYPDWITNFTADTSLPNNTLWKDETINIPAAAFTSQFKIRFRYTTDSSTNYYGWMIDNVKIYGPAQQVTWTSSPSTPMYLDAGASTTPYVAGTYANVIYTKPTGATQYTASATNGSCAATPYSATITPNALPTFTLPNMAICKGTPGVYTIPETSYGYSVVGGTPGISLSGQGSATITASPTVTTVYTILATDNTTGCQRSQQFTVTVNDPVVITGVSPNSVITVAGATKSFTVAATGTGLTYQWQESTPANPTFTNIGNGGVYSGATTATLTLTGVTTGMDGNQYQVIVNGTAPCAFAESQNIGAAGIGTLTVGEIDIVQPQSQTLCSTTSPITFTTSASSSTDPNATFTYDWEVKVGANDFVTVVDGFDATTGLTFDVSTTPGTLSFTGTSFANNGLIFHAIINGFLPTDDATLTLVAPAAISVQPAATRTVCASGGTTTFAVTASSTNGYQWQVKTPGGSFTNIANGGIYSGVTSATLTITNPTVAADGNQYQVVIGNNAPCTGSLTSAFGTLNINNPTISTPPAAATVVAGNTATFTVVTSAPSPTFVWERSANGTSGWATVADGTPATVTYTGNGTATLSVVTTASTAASTANYYRVTVTSGGCSVTSAAAQLTINNYCTPTVVTNTASYYDAFATTGGSTNISTSATGFATNGYANYTATQTVTQQQGSTVNFTSTLAGTTVGCAIWVDWNHNAIFETSERMAVTSTYVSSFSGSFVVPMDALPGSTRMRILLDYYTSVPANPCVISATGPRGEVEDYNFVVTLPPACTGTPTAGTAVITSANTCSGNTVGLSLTGNTTGVSQLTYQWWSRTLPSGTFAPISGATAATYTTPALTQSSEYYAVVTCGATGLSANSTTVGVTVSNCDYTVTRNTGINYSSIITSGTGSTYTSLSSADDGATNVVSLAGTTFKYQGAAVTGFYANSNGWMSFNTGTIVSSGTTAYYNDLTDTAVNNKLAPFWDDLVIQGNAIANKDNSMRYKVVGTLGSGSADIIVEWAEMEKFSYTDPNMNFQVVLHESDNSIDFNYGNMQLFNGATNQTTYGYPSYTIGLNGASPATATTSNRLILQYENTSNFAATTTQTYDAALGLSPACSSQLHFAPAAAYSGGAAPASNVPSNNEVATAITLPVNQDPCTSVCGNLYKSKNATASTGIPTCVGTADDDVFFKFTATADTSNYRVEVTPSIGYRAVIQILDSSLNSIVCTNTATQSLTQVIASQALAPGTYYLRVYDNASGAAGGASGSGEFSVCVSKVTPPPAFDEPAGAVALTVGTSCNAVTPLASDVLRATATAGVQTCSATTPGTADDDVWYKFTTGASISGLTHTITVQGVSTYNAVLQIFTGLPAAGNALACVNATNNGGVETYSSTTLSPNTTYYIRVYHSGTGAANGNFSICVTAPLTCVATPTAPAIAAALCQSTSATVLSWPAVTNATGYDVYLDTTGGSSVTPVSTNQSGTTYSAGVLAAGSYTWRVVPRNSYGSASACTNFTFTVNSIPTITTTLTAQTYCVGDVTSAISLTGTPAGVTFDISGGAAVGLADATGVSSIPSFTTVAGTATITVTPKNNGCSGTVATYLVTVNNKYPFFADTDGDGVGAGTAVQLCAASASAAPSGYSTTGTDCAPSDPTIWRTGNFYVDADNDGYYNGDPTPVAICYGATTPSGYVASIIAADCDDNNAQINPNHVEVMGNGVDDNCDGVVDEVAPTSSLQPTQCGITLTNIAQAIYANQVPGAQGYRFEVTLGANVRTYDSATSSFNLLQLQGGAAYATTYSIRVAVKTAPGFWRAYSSACNITTPALPDFTKIIPSQCGTTLTSLSTTIYCDQVTSANQYRFEVTNTSTSAVTTYDAAVNRFNMTNVGGQYATTYSVRVALRFGTTWMDFGTACNITTPATPGTSNVIPSQCGITISNSWTTIYANQVPEATGYRFEVVNGVTTRYFDTPNARFNLHNLAGAAPAPSTTYTIRVAILYNSVYQGFGPACTITTAATITRQVDTPVSVFAVKAYPNPFADNFKLNINTSSEDRVQLMVYDMLGKLIESREVNLNEIMDQEIGDRYSSGVYNVIVSQGANVETLRVIKR